MQVTGLLSHVSPIQRYVIANMTTVSRTQALHAGQKIGYRQHREDVITARINHPPQMLCFNHMANDSLRKIVEGGRDGQVTIRRYRSNLFSILLDDCLPGRMLSKALLYLRMETLRIANSVIRLGPREDCPHTIPIQHQKRVIGFQHHVLTVIRVFASLKGIASQGNGARRSHFVPGLIGCFE